MRQFRMHDDEWEIVQSVGGDNVSAWIRATLLRAAKRAIRNQQADR